MNTSRRSFLKVAGLSAFALSSGMAGLAGTAGAARAQIAPGRYERGENALTAKRWAMVIDTRQFRGPEDYEALIEACHKVHNVPHIPGGRYYDVVRQSYAELLQNQERFPNLKLLRGIELGQPLQDLNAAHDALTGRDYDVVIGSLHNIRDHDDFYHIGEHNPTEQEIDNALHAYFAESLEMVEWGKFDTLAHITYPLRYMCKAGETPSYKPYQDELDAVLKALIKSDIALEFNTSRILRTDAPKLPDREVYSRYKELGGKLVTIGADAHCTENIASGVEEAMELLSDIGYKEYTVFVERKPVQVPIE